MKSMNSITNHMKLSNPRFLCKAGDETLEVCLKNEINNPATPAQLSQLKLYAGNEFQYLEPLYSAFNGIIFHVNDVTAGLMVASINQIEGMNNELQDWLDMMEPEDLADFQKHGVAFATIESSGNYFIIYQGHVYYSDHDDFNEAVYAESVEDFFKMALENPAKFLNDAGCYTRYYDGKSNKQYIPEAFLCD